MNKSKIPRLLKLLHEIYPNAIVALRHKNAFELLAATILSAQCTDERVNGVMPVLMKQYPTPQKLACARASDVEKIIRSTGFYRNKTKSLIGMAQTLIEKFDGVVPQTMEELIELPGVARKTANVVLGSVFKIAEGVVVDTHVRRITQLLGLTRHFEPEKIERDLMAILPKSEWIFFGDSIILHGRRICVARRPACDQCRLNELCPSAFQGHFRMSTRSPIPA